MKKITSTTNEHIKTIVKLHQRKYRKESGLFLLEGKKAVEEAIAAGIEVKEVFTTIEEYKIPCEITAVSMPVMEKISTTKSAPEIVAVARQPEFSLKKIKNCARVVLFEGIKDAGNLGTIIRSAAAFELDAIVLFGDTVDAFNPKTVRSAAGALGKVPIVESESFEEIKTIFSGHDFYATVLANDAKAPEKSDFNKPFVLMFGSEADGLSETTTKAANKKLKLDISPQAESLNLGVAASIFFWEISKSNRG